MKEVAVTGGAGFVGRRLVKRLLDMDCNVTIIDDLSSGIRPVLDEDSSMLDLFHMDLRKFCREYENTFDTIFHCAAVVGGRLTIDGDPIRVATDLAVDSDFFNWLVKAKKRPEKVVYFSSSAAYPIMLQRKGQHCVLTETFIDFSKHKLGTPDSTYGWAKLTGEFLAQYAAKKHGINVVCYRPFSGYGEDQSLDYPFPSIIRRVMNRENPLVVWGSGDQERDFIHIDDVVEAVLATMAVLAPGEALNLGTGVATTFKQLATRASNAAGRHVEVVNDSTKPEGVFSRVADSWKLNQWYKPKISLSEGIKRSLDHLDRERKAS